MREACACVGGVGTVPAAGSAGACTCGLDRQWRRRVGGRRCDGQRWGSVEGCLGRRRGPQAEGRWGLAAAARAAAA